MKLQLKVPKIKRKLRRYGTSYGGFLYPEPLHFCMNQHSVIFCVGAGEDISHDIILAHKTKAHIHIFDPTPRAIHHVQQVKDVLDSGIIPAYDNKIGGGDPNYWKLLLQNRITSDRIVMHPYGLSKATEMTKFYKPKNKNHVSHSVDPKLQQSKEYIMVPMKSIQDAMKEIGVKKIDLIKMDIEGAECPVLEAMLDNNILPMYVAVEFDSARIPGERSYQTIVQKFIEHGYAITSVQDYNVVMFRDPILFA